MTTQPIVVRRRRPWLAILGIVGLAVWVLALFTGALALLAGAPIAAAPRDWRERAILGEGPEKVAMVEIVGTIVPGEGGSGFFGETFGADDWVSQLRQAAEDPRVQAVVVRLDTPGGSVVASDQVFEAVRAVEEAGKPVVALMGGVAASGGYYIAAGARQIVANPSTITGSIGVIWALFNLEGAAEKLGIEPVVLKRGDLKDIGSPWRDMTPEEVELLQTLLDEAYDQFVNAIVEGRGMDRDDVLAVADGRIISGSQARNAGLVDVLGDLEDAYELAKQLAAVEDARLVTYRRPRPGLFDTLLFRSPGAGDQMALRQLARELTGVPTSPGLHYLWIQ